MTITHFPHQTDGDYRQSSKVKATGSILRKGRRIKYGTPKNEGSKPFHDDEHSLVPKGGTPVVKPFHDDEHSLVPKGGTPVVKPFWGSHLSLIDAKLAK